VWNWLCLVSGHCGSGCVWWVISVEVVVFYGWSVWNWLCLVGGQCGTGCVWRVVNVEVAVFGDVVIVELAVW